MDFLEVTSRTVFNIEQNCEEFGLDRALNDDPRRSAQIEFDDRVKIQIVAMVCSDPPEGFDRRTVHLLQEKAIKDNIVESISHEKSESFFESTL